MVLIVLGAIGDFEALGCVAARQLWRMQWS